MGLRLALYQLGIRLLGLAMWIASPWQPKLRQGYRGRKNWRSRLRALRQLGERWIWMHCASLGEFEQGRNLIERLKAEVPEVKVMITFFSPSGYEVRKNYRHADAVSYLPLDTPANARDWLRWLEPELVFFVKYELWLQYLLEMQRREIPLLLVSARVTPESRFFHRALAPLYRRAFGCFRHIFTQDEPSLRLISALAGHARLSVSSDTRYDRVRATHEAFTALPEIETFVRGRLCIVAGSTWPADEAHLLPSVAKLAQTYDLCLIIAPHEIHPEHIDKHIKAAEGQAIRYSQIEKRSSEHHTLWIDNIGMLSRLYHYADVAYVGGAWGTGLHNVLEAVVFGVPVIFGPQHAKFPEAGELMAQGGGFSIDSRASLEARLTELLSNEALRSEIRRRNRAFIQARAGATDHIVDWCQSAGIWPG